MAARAGGLSWPEGEKSYFSGNFFVYKGVFNFFQQLNDNVKVKMFSDDNSHSESKSYYPDELNFHENEPVSASTSHNNFKNVNNSEEIASDIKKVIYGYRPQTKQTQLGIKYVFVCF